MDDPKNPIEMPRGFQPDAAQTRLPSALLIGSLTYGGSLIAGIGLFMWLSPAQTLVPASTGLPSFVIELIFLGFALDGMGAYLLIKRGRLMRARSRGDEAA
ncbi:MAG: hypothetical protein ACR2QB_12320 [Gammaproteobacteria bacterium]